MSNKKFIFNISVITSFTEDEIIEFMALSDLGYERTERVLVIFYKEGIHNLCHVNILLKLGYNLFSK